MEWTRSGEDIFLRIDPGEEIHETIRKLADQEQINAGAITSGVGRTRENLHGYMDEDGVYHQRMVSPPSELVSISGNIARKEDGSSFTHIHACWAEDDGTVFAGHMFSCVVEVVAEIHIRVMSKSIMTRCPIEGMQLLKLRFS